MNFNDCDILVKCWLMDTHKLSIAYDSFNSNG